MTFKKGDIGHKTHGLGKPATYSHWYNMKTRCFNKNNHKYKDYGARGITVCNEWVSFVNFHNWAMNNGFEEGLTLERIDVNGNYCPENCTWIPMAQQAKNKRTSRLITYNGITDTIQGWTKRLGFKKETLRNRLNYYGWSVEDALTKGVRGGDAQ